MNAAEMKMSKWVSGIIRMDRKGNNQIKRKLTKNQTQTSVR